VYISIVGVDHLRNGFCRAKLQAEQSIEESGLPWTVLRATEFHDLLMTVLQRLSRAPAALVPRGSLLQPVDAGEVADRLVDLAMKPAAGRVRELGGPRVESMAELTRCYLTAARRSRAVIEVPVPARWAAGFGVGGHLLAHGDCGTVTFADHVRARLTPDPDQR
jgi:uncharacterized protein YbjT (DUF2867 family)